VLEREINGVTGMRYMSSISSEDGNSSITITFDQGYDIDIAAVDVLNRVSVAEPQLPSPVQQTGVSITKQSGGDLVGMAIFSEEDGLYDDTFISNYADLYVLDELTRINGVSRVQPFGERRYAMRLWLDPTRMASRGLSATDVTEALEEQNIQVGAGRIGQPPAEDGLQYQLPVQTAGRLRDVSEFDDLVLATGDDGALIKLSDVGRAELGSEDYNTFARYSTRGAVGYLVQQSPNSNALATAQAVKARMAELAESFPPGLTYEIPYDPTLFVVESREEVVNTLLQAIALVVLVLFVFLQNWRATIVPAIVIPISLIGTFAFVKLFNFSINSLTLFGLTLATGMVVDDAIVVVEDIAGKVQEKGMRPHLAAIEAMRELSSAVIATSLVLLAVFLPVAFFPGTTGQLYRQFALTIAFSIVISTFNALSLTPALSALLLRQGQQPGGWLGRIFEWLNDGIDRMRRGYRAGLSRLTQARSLVIGLFVASLVVTFLFYQQVPTAFLPEEDQGYVISVMQAPDGTSLQYTSDVITQIEDELLQYPEVAGTFSLGGFSFTGNTANRSLTFVPFIPWGDRPGSAQTAQSFLGKVFAPLSQILEGQVFTINPPAIQGLGNVGGFVFHLQDRGNNSIETLVNIRDQLVARANEQPEMAGSVFSTYTANSPQLLVDIDRNRAKALQVNIDEILNTLQIYLGSQYVNDFNAFGRSYRVYIHADSQFRSTPEDLNQLYVRSELGEMIPLGNLVRTERVVGPQTINHYNLFRSIEINGIAAPGYSSGQALDAMERVAAEVLPNSMGFEWSGISLEELDSGGLAPIIFGLGILFVFLVLAAQYENFVDPFIILLAVPLAILGAIGAITLRGIANDVYCQVGLVMLIGLASKNSILIVEFANQLREQGLSIVKAAVEASQQRLRPIVMTAVSTLLGIFPLTIATGAGSASRQSLGTAVFGGMIFSTVLSLFVVPILYIAISILYDRLRGKKPDLSGMEDAGSPPMSGGSYAGDAQGSLVLSGDSDE
ncbi:MAG: efflux RND transporter permease subunit, partial [Cyanobacteria bacterium P01_G01_bin.4]